MKDREEIRNQIIKHLQVREFYKQKKKDSDVGIIVETLLKLPDDAREIVLSNAFFGIWSEELRGVCVPIYLRKKILTEEEKREGVTFNGCFIILNFSEKASVAEKMSMVAHEIAHFISNQYSATSENGIDQNVEKGIDDIVEKWGFLRAYESYDHLKDFESK